MKAEIIAVGSELLTPDHIDTNSLFITQKLNELGFEVHLKTVVGDNQDAIAGVLHSALGRSHLIIFSGGLGPTEDDRTRAAVAGALRRRIRVEPAILEALRRKFSSRGYPMPQINERQAEVIEGAEVLDNSVGTAPGMWLEQNGVYIVLLPGPPREMRAIFETQVLPRARRLGKGRRLVTQSFHVTGMTESEVDSRVAPIYATFPSVRTTILATPAHIALRLYQWVEEGGEPSDLQELSARIQEELGDAIFTATGESLEEVVGQLLRRSGQTLAVAESCTSGIIGMRVTRVPGSSDYFLGGVLCYSNALKRLFCGIPADLLAKHGAVSAEVAEALARGVRERVGSSIGLSVTGIAGPGGGSQEKPVGLVYVGLSDRGRTIHLRKIVPGDRDTMRERTAYFALSRLRKFLLEQPAVRPTSGK